MGVKKKMDDRDDEEDIIPLAKSRRRVVVKREVGEEDGEKGKVHLSPDAQILSWEMGMNPGFVMSEHFTACI
jgi:hypothetical protein